MKKLLNLPDSFKDYGEAEKHLIKCCDLASKKVDLVGVEEAKNRIFLLCSALDTDPFDIFERVKKGGEGDER